MSVEKNVICRKCGSRSTVPRSAKLTGGSTVVCAVRGKDGARCLGQYRLAAPRHKF